MRSLMPLRLQDLAVPHERAAAILQFKRFIPRGTHRIEDLVIKIASHETGHAIGWALNGGKLARTTIIPEGNQHGVLWGCTDYDIGDDMSVKERLRHAFAAMGGAALCLLAGTPEYGDEMEDFESAVDDLRMLHANRAQLGRELIRTW